MGWTLTDAHFLQMGGIAFAAIHRKGPDRKTRFFTLTVPVLDAIYKSTKPLSSTSTSTSPAPPAEGEPPSSIPFCLTDIDDFTPPPPTIGNLDPTQEPSPSASKDSLKMFKLNPFVVLSSLHANLPSCLPPPSSHSPPDLLKPITPTKPTVSSHLTTVFPADPLLAIIVLLQLVWFLSGCIARIVISGWRELLLIEVLVLAYISIYVMTIAAWWHKPMVGLGGEPVKIVLFSGLGKSGSEDSEGALAPLKVEAVITKVEREEQEVPKKQNDLKGKAVDRTASGSSDGNTVVGPHDVTFEDEEAEEANDIPLHALQTAIQRSTSGGSTAEDGSENPSGSSSMTAVLTPEPLQLFDDDIEKPPKDESTQNRASTATNDTSTNTNSDYDNSLNILSSLFIPLVQWRCGAYFYLDRVHEFFLKTTGYDDNSRDYDLSTNAIFSNISRSDARLRRREGIRHQRRVDGGWLRVTGLGPSDAERGTRVIGGHTYPHVNGVYFNDEEHGISESVRRRREAGSGGHSRFPTFYAYVTDRGYRTVEEMKMKVLVGVVCGLLFGGIHLLGIAFKEVPSSTNSATSSIFSKHSPEFVQHVLYLFSSLVMTVVPPFFSFCALRLSESIFMDDWPERAVILFLVEALGLPLGLLYVPAKICVVVLAILQLIRRARMGMGLDGGAELGIAFDGVNPAGAWWLSFLPHFS
ncbi:hypothetical protein EST38_g385 [Candolleomyces aberdarensis]|uniref:Uncharacterized protein n=1 Tax=Candolleomyces aberdarensis TaxID=2316362 RepID=A0A4Q2DYI4_9AGAR|nr:hypothetical protein EST38_g385 [Candolleomyces aberdarensis]